MSYLGQSFSFAPGWTGYKYVYWLYNNGLGSSLTGTNDPTVIAALGTDDCLLFLNRNGFPINALTVDMLYGDLIVPGTILTDHLAAHAIQASNITLDAQTALIPNGSFNELDKTDPTKPAYWTTLAGDGTLLLTTSSTRLHSPGGYAIRLTQTVGTNILTSGEFTSNTTGWSMGTPGSTAWQSGWSASGQMKVTVFTAGVNPTLTSPTFAVTAGSTYNLIAAMEADGTGSTPTSPVNVNMQIQWLNSSGAVISTSSYQTQEEPQVTTATDAFGLLQAYFVAPAGAVNGKVLLGIPSDPTQNTIHYFDYIRVTQSTYAQVWSDPVPVSPMEWLRVTYWALGIRTTTDTMTCTVNFHSSDPLFTPATAEATLYPITTPGGTSTDLGFNTTWTKYTGTVQIPAGMQYMRMVLGTEPGTYQTAETYNVYFDDASVENISAGSIQSSDYVESVTGWALKDAGGTSQVDSLNVINSVGADVVSANTIQLNNDDLQTDIIDILPQGTVYYANIASGIATANIGTTSVLAFTFNLGELQYNRRYMVLCSFHFQTTASDEGYDFSLRYDTNGAKLRVAGDGNNILDGSFTRLTSGAFNDGVHIQGFFQTTGTWAAIDNGLPVYMGLTVQKVGTGPVSGTGNIYMGGANRSLQLQIIDVGSTLAGFSNKWAQLSKSTGTADVDPPATYTKKFLPNSTRSYDSDGTRRLADTTNPDMYQGRYSSIHGNQSSCAVYDWASIQSALSGATGITVKLTFRVKHTYTGAGINVSVHQHTYSGSTTPSVYRPGAEIATKNGCKEGSTYTITLPASFGTALQNGTAKGIGFGKPSSTNPNYYGYMYGAGSGSAPFMTITYTK